MKNWMQWRLDVISCFLLISCNLIHAQGIPHNSYNKYWIVFTDKNNSPYSISNPSAYLSARAIYRRTKYGIPIKWNDLPPNPAYIDSVIAKGVILLNRSGWFNAISIFAPDTDVLPSIRALPFVKNSKFVTIVKPGRRAKKPQTINNNYSGSSPGVVDADTFNYGYAYNQVHMIGVDCLNNKGFRGKGKRIAQIDARFGVADTLSAFDSLRARKGILGTWDFVWEDADVYDDTNNIDSHGQMVLSCMAGNLPGEFLGDAADADFYLLRTEDISSEYMIEDDNWASGAEYADSAGADIITSSLGYTTFDDGTTNYTYAEMNGKVAVASVAATIASEKGMVPCIAAGNQGNQPWHYIDSPADADSILSVGAVDQNENYDFLSSTGPTSDGRIKPDVAAQGENTALVSPSGGIGYGSGTSFATPLIAGGVACLWQTDTDASNFQVMSAVKRSASQYLHPDSLLGYGIPDFCLASMIISGMKQNKEVEAISSVFPNPFTSDVTLLFYSSFRQPVQVSVYNTLGQLYYKYRTETAANGNTLIKLNGLERLPSGLYIITLTNNNGAMFSVKIMKQ